MAECNDDDRSIGEVEQDTLMLGERRQTITFNLDDLVNLALQRALNDGNGLDWTRDSAVMLDVFGQGHEATFDGGLEGEVADFTISWNEETGAIEAKAEHDTMATVTLTIINWLPAVEAWRVNRKTHSWVTLDGENYSCSFCDTKTGSEPCPEGGLEDAQIQAAEAEHD